MVARCVKLVRVMVTDLVDARPAAYRPLVIRPTSQEYLDVDHVVLLYVLWLVVLRTVENQVARFHLMCL